MKKDIRLKILLLGLLACLSVGVTSAASPEWLEKMKQIRLLESKRQDVVALFGPAKPAGNALIDTWGLVDGSLSAIYASGECVAKTENGKTKLLGWRVPKDTVIEISFSLNKPVSPKKLGIDLSRLRGEQVRDQTGALYFDDETAGAFYYAVNGKITEVGFYPRTELDYLDCEPQSEGQR
ncbi:MAG: hypothetical protein IPK58_06000 [Acidobacteria bacterium]|nr:hypothetical protein [Acidobacteriota bacterium]